MVRRSLLQSSPRLLILVTSSLLLGLMLSIMDTSIVATSLVVIGKDFDDFIHVTWVVLAYLLTYTGRRTRAVQIRPRFSLNGRRLHAHHIEDK